MSFDAGAVEATLTLDRTPFIASLRDAQRQVTGFARRTFEATLGADQTGFAAALANARREGASFARENYEASIGARGTTETVAEIKAVDTVADRLDGRDIDVDVDPGGRNTAKLGSLSGGFRGLASNIKATRTVLFAAAIPAGIAAIGAGIPTIAALSASLGGLAVALGSGLVGATVAATAALGGLAGAFGLVAAPVSLLLGNLKDYDDSLDAVKSAEGAARTAAQSRTAALKTLSDAQANVASTARESKEAIEEQQAVLNRTRAEATAAINAQERVVAAARRTGTEAVAEEEQKLAQVRVEGARAIAEQERTLEQTRISASDANAQAEGELERARLDLSNATRSLSAAQDDLNRALREEPLNQAQATLDLASARDRASDSLRAYNEAVAEFGTNSEEASDARRELAQSNLDLKQTEIDVRDARRNGTEELQNARKAVSDVSEEQEAAADAISAAEQRVVDTRAEGLRQIQEQRRQLLQTRQDATGQIDEQRNALKAARDERVQGEREALAELVRISREGNQQIRDEEDALNDTRADGAERVAEAQTAAVEAQRAAAAAARDAADAQKAVREETVKLTPAQKALFDEYKRFQQIADTAFLGAQNASARLGVSILGLAENFLPRLGRVSEDTIGALTRSFETFRNELAQPVEQAGITRYLSLIPDLTEEAATAAGKLGLALFNVFARSLRFALPLTTAVGDIADEFLRWTESARGTRAIDKFFEDSVDMALRLGPIIGDLAAGFSNLVSALDRTGIVDQSVRGFSALAESFAESTREGGGLDTFLRNARDLMPFVASAAKAVGGAILGIASAAIGATEKGSKLTILQGIFKNIAEAAKPLQNLVIGTFRNLGPAIAELLPPLTRFFDAFGEGASQTLATFVNTLTRALNIFNSLPPGVKRTVGQLAALKIILGGLGITALVAPMGRFASNMLIARGAAAKLGGKAALPAVVGSIARLGVLLAGGLGLGLLAAGLFRAYQKNEDFRKSVNTLGDRAGEVFQGISNKVSNKVLPALTTLADKGARLLLDIFDLNKKKDGKTPEENGVHAVRQFGLGVKTGGDNLSKDGGPLEETGSKMGAAVARGLNNWAKGGGKGDKDGPQGGLAGFLNRLNAAAVEGGKNWRIGFVREVNKTNWKAVGNRAKTDFFEGLHNFGEGVRDFVDGIRKQINKSKWGGSGRFIAAAVLSGLGLASLTPVVLWLDNVRKKISEHRKDFKTSGTNAAAGFLEGFAKSGISGGVAETIKRAYENLGKEQKDGSPSKLWMVRGKNAGLGWLKGFGDTIKATNLQDLLHGLLTQVGVAARTGNEELTRQAKARLAQTQGAVMRARNPASPGGKSITAAEMRSIMKEAHSAQAKNIYAAAVAAGLDPRVLKLLDSIMAKDFNFRTNMLADAR